VAGNCNDLKLKKTQRFTAKKKGAIHTFGKNRGGLPEIGGEWTVGLNTGTRACMGPKWGGLKDKGLTRPGETIRNKSEVYFGVGVGFWGYC